MFLFSTSRHALHALAHPRCDTAQLTVSCTNYTPTTAYPALEPVVKLAGAQWLAPEPITACFEDGPLVTGAAWPAHPEFCAKFAQALGVHISLSE